MRQNESDLKLSLVEEGPHSDYVHQHHLQTERRRVCGRLRLSFAMDRDSGRTILSSSEQQPPLRIVRAFPHTDGAVLLHLHNVSGGVLGGDFLELEIEVDRDARAQLTTTGATRLYRHHPTMSDAMQFTQVTVRENGMLEYLPDQLIPFAGSRYRQTTSIELDAGAGLFWWEIVAPGREAREELFDYERLELKTEIRAPDGVIAIERNRIEPRIRPLNSPVRLGNYRHFASLYICRVGLDAPYWLALEKDLGEIAERLSRLHEILWGISTLPAHGLVVRVLSISGRDILPGLVAFWQHAKRKLYGLEAILPRKIW